MNTLNKIPRPATYRAALKTEGDVGSDGLIAKPWRICTVQQVEDLKTLIRIIRIFPLLSSNIFLGTPIGVLTSLTIFQALTMDCHLGPHFEILAESILVVRLITTANFITTSQGSTCKARANYEKKRL